jgi:hypothetical protein
MRSSCNTKSQTNGAAMSLEFFYASKLHNRRADGGKTFPSEVGARDVFDVRA